MMKTAQDYRIEAFQGALSRARRFKFGLEGPNYLAQAYHLAGLLDDCEWYHARRDVLAEFADFFERGNLDHMLKKGFYIESTFAPYVKMVETGEPIDPSMWGTLWGTSWAGGPALLIEALRAVRNRGNFHYCSCRGYKKNKATSVHGKHGACIG